MNFERISYIEGVPWFSSTGDLMMTSSNGNIFRVTGPLCREFTGPGEFPAQRPVTRSFDVFFDLRMNKRLSKQSWGRWFETPQWSSWRQCNVQIFLQGPSHVCTSFYTIFLFFNFGLQRFVLMCLFLTIKTHFNGTRYVSRHQLTNWTLNDRPIPDPLNDLWVYVRIAKHTWIWIWIISRIGVFLCHFTSDMPALTMKSCPYFSHECRAESGFTSQVSIVFITRT